MREPRHPWLLMHNQDRKSRQRSSKPRRQCGLSGATTLLSLRYLFCHFCAPLKGIKGSLVPAFASASLILRDTVRQAFALALFSKFLTWMSLPLGPRDIFSRGCRPSQTVRLPLSPFGLAFQQQISSVTLAIILPKGSNHLSYLRYALIIETQ